ncbi:MAG TPA: hypothetical protein PLP19_15355 [bacterium]|nr:hypothetical protein [bacterium]HPN44868.1 hypothetical protein [bacterium]
MTLLNITQFHIAVNNIILFLLFSLGGLIFSLYIYRYTLPPVSKTLKRILTGLRITVLFLLLTVLFELSVNLVRTIKEEAQLAVAIDTSASMAVIDNAGDRAALLKEVLQNPVFAKLQNNFITNYYTFANTTQKITADDSITFVGDATNITSSLQVIKKELSEKNLSAIILISDGNYNRGGNPVRLAEQTGVPVYTIGLGSDTPLRDLAIAEVENNPFCYLEESTPLTVTIRNNGYNQISTPVTLSVNDELVDSQILTLPASPSETIITYNFTPKTTGLNRLVINLPAQKSELLVQNNSRTFYIDVLKSRLYIQIYAGSITPDISFIRNSIESSKRYTVGLRVEKNGGGFYTKDNNNLQDTDILIFIDFPSAATDQATLNQLKSTLENNNTPLWVITGKNTNLAKLANFENWLPFKCNASYINEIQILAEPDQAGKSHPIMQPAVPVTSWFTNWTKLPPIFSVHQIKELWPQTQTLVYAKTVRGQQSTKPTNPLLVIRNNNSHKSAAFLGYGLWRWELLMLGTGDESDIYNTLVNNMLRWLETKRETSAWQIKTDKSHYHFGEPIKISVDITDKTLATPETSELTLLLAYEQVSESVTVTRSSDRSYTTVLYLDKAGDYTLSLNRDIMPQIASAPDEALFSVGEYSIELNNTQLQKSILQDLANNTGGRYITPDSTAMLESLVHGVTKSSVQTINKEIWNNKYLLFLLIIFLSLEWFLRKKKGML